MALSVQDLVKFSQDHQAEIDKIYVEQHGNGIVSIHIDDIEGKPALRLVFEQNAPPLDPSLKQTLIGGVPVVTERQVTVEMSRAFGEKHGDECDRLIEKYRDKGLEATYLEGHETPGKLTILLVFKESAEIDPALHEAEIGGNPVVARHKGEGIKRTRF